MRARIAGICKPPWEYDAATLAKDLSAHVAFGAATGLAFTLLMRRKGASAPIA